MVAVCAWQRGGMNEGEEETPATHADLGRRDQSTEAWRQLRDARQRQGGGGTARRCGAGCGHKGMDVAVWGAGLRCWSPTRRGSAIEAAEERVLWDGYGCCSARGRRWVAAREKAEGAGEEWCWSGTGWR